MTQELSQGALLNLSVFMLGLMESGVPGRRDRPKVSQCGKPGKPREPAHSGPLCVPSSSGRMLCSCRARRAPLKWGLQDRLTARSYKPSCTCCFSDAFSLKYSMPQGAMFRVTVLNSIKNKPGIRFFYNRCTSQLILNGTKSMVNMPHLF